MRDSRDISPTAHYTGYVWVHYGLSHPAFATLTGQLMFQGLRLPQALSRRFNGPSLDAFLLARHSLIDHLLHEAIEQGKITQVIEIAAGLSPRGWRFSQRYGKALSYIEADLPDMAEQKRQLLEQGGLSSSHHHVVEIDALKAEGPQSLQQLIHDIGRSEGTAIITEGLVNYFDTTTVQTLWQNIAANLSTLPRGMYLSDMHLGNMRQEAGTKLVMNALGRFVKNRVYLHFSDELAATQALHRAGFSEAQLLKPSHHRDVVPHCEGPGIDRVRIVHAHTGDWS